jgi:D-amino-acid oxidase
MDILVIGSGVSGLSSAIRLQESRHRVAVVARDLPPNTTSNAAAAVWEPFEAYPADRVAAWGAVAYRDFLALADDPRAGILRATVLEVLREPAPPPDWASAVEGFRPAEPAELPPGSTAGFTYRAPVIDTSRYLSYLTDRFLNGGGRVAQRTLGSFDEAFALRSEFFEEGAHAGQPEVVVNCAGLGARELAHDSGVAAARGQVVRIEQCDFHQVIVSNTKGRPTYVVPRFDDIVLGGTFDVGAEDTIPLPATRTDILMRCAELVLVADPRLAMSLAALVGGQFAADFAARVGPENVATPAAVIREDAVGLRPISPRVRVEIEPHSAARVVVHNYGHGGAGVTLSWGCAAEVAELVASVHPV